MLKEFGQDLKFLRESKNITIAEISAETRINPKFFLNFESGDFDFQPETYIRAFLKEYARCINEDERQIVHDYALARSGFYARKYVVNAAVGDTIPAQTVEEPHPTAEAESKPDFEKPLPPGGLKSASAEQTADSDISYGYVHSSDIDTLRSNKRKRTRQKILLAVIVLVIVAGVIFLINYLNKTSGPKQISDVKPKSFDEMSEEYETRMKGKNDKNIADSIKSLSSVLKNDSLVLTVKAVKEVRIKVYLDENHLTEQTIPAGDSLSIKAKNQFRFSATSGSNIELSLNNQPLQKPRTLPGASIKNLIIRKDGIITQ